jgi:hypothetical protein
VIYKGGTNTPQAKEEMDMDASSFFKTREGG